MKELFFTGLKHLFNNSTRGYRSKLMLVSTLFFIVGVMDMSGAIDLQVPPLVKHHEWFITILLAFNIFTGTLSFTLDKNNYRKRAKIMMLLGNCCFNLIMAMSFYTITPPYDASIFYALAFTIWTLLAIVYVTSVEGLNNGIDT